MNTKIYRLRPSGFPPLARANLPSGTARKAAGDLQQLRGLFGVPTAGSGQQFSAFRRLLAGGQKLCHQHNFRGVRSSENISFLGDLPRSLRRGAVGKLRTTSTRSPVCPTGRSRRRSPAAFRPGIPPPATNPYLLSFKSFIDYTHNKYQPDISHERIEHSDQPSK